MSTYTAEVVVGAPIDQVFACFIDAARYPQWQALALRAFDQTGSMATPGSSVRIAHGPGIERKMTVLEADPPVRLVYDQRGMGLDDTTTVTFEGNGARTRVRMSAELRIAGGLAGRVLERLALGVNRKEFQLELDRFAEVAERPLARLPEPGAIVTVDCGAGFRVVSVLAVDERSVHVALHPGVAKQRPADVRPYIGPAPGPIPDPLNLRRLELPVRKWATKVPTGHPELRADNGVGVPHLAFDRHAWGDCRPESTDASRDPSGAELAEIDAWRAAGGPVVGATGTTITSLMTLRDGARYAVAKLLRAEIWNVHVRVYADRWDERPASVDPWGLVMFRVGTLVQGVEHAAYRRMTIERLEPKFLRLVMLGSDEAEGYRAWKQAGGTDVR